MVWKNIYRPTLEPIHFYKSLLLRRTVLYTVIASLGTRAGSV